MSDETSMNQLSALQGTWSGEENIAASKWGPGGIANAQLSARLDLNDRVLIQDYSAERDGKRWLAAHAVFVFDQAKSAYSLYWFDSLGFTPTEPAAGAFDGSTLKFLRVSPRGQTRHVYTFPSGGEYVLRLESSFDGGATWNLVMEGRYSRNK